jgi:hypothetical protein
MFSESSISELAVLRRHHCHFRNQCKIEPVFTSRLPNSGIIKSSPEIFGEIAYRSAEFGNPETALLAEKARNGGVLCNISYPLC